MNGRNRESWVDVTLKEYVNQRHAELEHSIAEVLREIEQRFTSQERFDELQQTTLTQQVNSAIEKADSAIEMIERQMDTHTRAHEKEHEMTETAIAKAEGMMADRLQALADATRLRAEQAGELASRADVDTLREQILVLNTETVTRREFDGIRKFVYMGVGMAVIIPILLTISFFVASQL